jgi:hypothetical protein
MTAWSLWRKRNLKLWEDKTETMEHVIGRTQGTLHAWQHARHSHTNDEKGTFVAALTTYCEAVMTIAEGEAWGLYQGIQWISSLGYHNVIFELDCKMVVDDVHNSKMNLSEYGSIIQNCRTLLDHYNDFVVVFTRRQANGSAHALAREALSHASRSTFDVIPFCIATIIMNETP